MSGLDLRRNPTTKCDASIMTVEDKTARGSLVAAMVRGAWRQAPPTLELREEQLERVAAPLLESGAGALAWWRITRSAASHLFSTPAASLLQQAYRLHTIHAALHERELIRLFSILNEARVEALLVKGWAAARLYPEAGLRPYGDADLCVRVDQYSAAREALDKTEEGFLPVDLHAGFSKLGNPEWDELYARSEVVMLDRVPVRVPCPEDHLRALCCHLLRHGGWRPLWLCDVAAAVESLHANFDWDLCLSETRPADRVTTAIGLAHQLLGAETGNTPAGQNRKPLPRWLVRNVLAQWDAPRVQPHYHIEMKSYMERRRLSITDGLRRRWPNAIEATVAMGAPLNHWPRFPFQLASFTARTLQFIAQLPRHLRERRAQDRSFIIKQLPEGLE